MLAAILCVLENMYITCILEQTNCVFHIHCILIFLLAKKLLSKMVKRVSNTVLDLSISPRHSLGFHIFIAVS